jgi:hypothetical protein
MDFIMINSFTLAMRASEILKSQGIAVTIEKRTTKQSGCGYILFVANEDTKKVISILQNNMIKYKTVSGRDLK